MALVQAIFIVAFTGGPGWPVAAFLAACIAYGVAFYVYAVARWLMTR